MNATQFADATGIAATAVTAAIADHQPAQTEFIPSPERIQKEISFVLNKTISSDLQSWVDRYGAVGKRNTYLWPWCRRGVEITTMSCVEPDLYDHVCDTKVLGVMLDVLLDDVADQKGDTRLLEHMVAIPYGQAATTIDDFAPELRGYVQLTVDVWNEIQRRIRQYPCYETYADLIRYDYLQLMNAMRYSHLLNRIPSLLNLAEHDLYLPHNMHMMISAMIDLSASPSFDHRELGHLRDAVWHAQYMGRIGNLTTTWQREVGEGDYTSGVFARAVAVGDLTVEDLLEGDRQRIEHAIREGRHEEFFLQRWQEHRRELLEKQSRLRSVNLQQLVAGLERLICLHLGSRGYK